MGGEMSGRVAGGVSHRRTSPDDIIDEWANAPEDNAPEDADRGGEEDRPAPRPDVIAEMKEGVPYLCPPQCGDQHHDHKRFDSLRALVQYGLMTISNAWVDSPGCPGMFYGSIPPIALAVDGKEFRASDEDTMYPDEPTLEYGEDDTPMPVRVLPYESRAFVAFWRHAKIKAELDLLVYLNPVLSMKVDEARWKHEPIEWVPEVDALLNQWRHYWLRDDGLPASFVRHAHRVLVKEVDEALNRILRTKKHPERREEKIRKYGYDNVADLLIPDDACATVPGDPDDYRSFLTGLTLEELLGDPRRVWGGDEAEPDADPDIPMNEWDLSTPPKPQPKYRILVPPSADDDRGTSSTTDDEPDPDWDF